MKRPPMNRRTQRRREVALKNLEERLTEDAFESSEKKVKAEAEVVILRKRLGRFSE